MNTEKWAFGDWWHDLNGELAKLGWGEAGFGMARHHYNDKETPAHAAQSIIDTWKEGLTWPAYGEGEV